MQDYYWFNDHPRSCAYHTYSDYVPPYRRKQTVQEKFEQICRTDIVFGVVGFKANTRQKIGHHIGGFSPRPTSRKRK